MTLTDEIAKALAEPIDKESAQLAQKLYDEWFSDSVSCEDGWHALYTLLLKIKRLEAQVEQSQGKFIEGYICCLAGMVRSHGANTAEFEAARQCGPADKIRKYASPDDIKDLEDAGCSIE